MAILAALVAVGWRRAKARARVAAALRAPGASPETALALDCKNPHSDRKLAGRRLQDRGPLPKMAPLQRPAPTAQNIEQQMLRLRKLVVGRPASQAADETKE